MDLIFVSKPILLLFVVLPIAILHIAAFVCRNKKLCLYVELLNVALHSASVYLIWMMGGGYEDTLVLVLASSIVALLRHKPEKEEKGGENK